jgi:hypothetical protein
MRSQIAVTAWPLCHCGVARSQLLRGFSSVTDHNRALVLLLMVAACGLGQAPARASAAENAQAPKQIPIVDGPSIQKALDSQPGRIIFLPPGDYTVSSPIRISHENSGLVGPGRIVQTNPNELILMVSRADNVQLRDLTLTRSPNTDGARSGLGANTCRNLVIDNVQVLDNRAPAAAMNIDKCSSGRISNCLVRNYKAIAVEDRTASVNSGIAFKCFDGTGIQLTGCRGMLVQANRIEEFRLLPTREARDSLDLGRITSRAAAKGTFVSQETWNSEHVPIGWHQGSGLYVGGPQDSDLTQVISNYIENAAQGMDIQSDHVTIAQNIVCNSDVGMKAMHGARNILIVGNQFNRCDMHGVLLMSGMLSHEAGKGVPEMNVPEGTPANIDGASIVAHNIFSDFGFGGSHWLVGEERSVICLERGQSPKSPPLSDVIVSGNIVENPSRRGSAVAGTEAKPRYRYALLIDQTANQIQGPIGIHVHDNLFDPGHLGISNNKNIK